MKYTDLTLRVILLLSLAILPMGCGGGGGGNPAGPTLTSITVTPANTSVAAGSTRQFTATGTYSDGTTKDITSQVTWSSSGVVQIGATTGLVTTTTAGGTATITASLGGKAGSTILTVTGGVVSNANVMSITVNGSLCSSSTSSGYFNKPCVSVTVCNPDGSACQVVTDLLLDTGSYGLRVFKQALPGLSLTQVVSGSGSLAECIHFADQSTIWGPVQLASVKLGDEAAVQVPIQVIDASFATPTGCGTPDAGPVDAGYTGILGVGPLAEDCGQHCVTSATLGVYFSCVGASCSGAAVTLANQVRNPVASLPADNNGVLVQLPAVASGGTPSINGSLILGIGTQSNNIPTGTTVFPTDQQGDFNTTFNGTSDVGFVDTGSNALYFPISLPLCTGTFASWFCPPSSLSLSATVIGAFGTPSQVVPFNIGNFSTIFGTGTNKVFSDVGGPSTFGFDWGLPFFMGRSVFIGINGTTSPALGTGPYVAF